MNIQSKACRELCKEKTQGARILCRVQINNGGCAQWRKLMAEKLNKIADVIRKS